MTAFLVAACTTAVLLLLDILTRACAPEQPAFAAEAAVAGPVYGSARFRWAGRDWSHHDLLTRLYADWAVQPPRLALAVGWRDVPAPVAGRWFVEEEACDG